MSYQILVRAMLRGPPAVRKEALKLIREAFRKDPKTPFRALGISRSSFYRLREDAEVARIFEEQK